MHGQGYYFTDRLTMEADIMAGKYVEYGEFNNNLYGTRLDTVREVIDSGKMCVLDVNPTVSSSPLAKKINLSIKI